MSPACCRTPGPSATTRSMNSASSMRAADCHTSTTRKFLEAPTPRSTFPGLPTSDASRTPTSSASSSATSSRTIFPGPIGRHNTKFGVDFNYLPITATFTVNYGGVYDFGTFGASSLGFVNPDRGLANFPDLSPVQAYGAGLPGDFIQGIGSPSDSFHNIPIGAFWQDSWRVIRTSPSTTACAMTLKFLRPFKPPQGLALPLTVCSDCKKEFRPTPTTFSRASAWHGIPQGTARRSSALLTECSMTIRCSAFTSSAMPPTDLRADSLPLPEHRSAAALAIPET